MTGKAPEPQLTFEHVYLTEPEAARLLDGYPIRRGEWVMEPKAQIVGQADQTCRPEAHPALPPALKRNSHNLQPSRLIWR